MSERALATFLHTLLSGPPRAAGPLRTPTLLQRFVAQPTPIFQELLTAHVDTLLADLPDSDQLRPATIPATALWVAAALNNLALSTTRNDPRLLSITLRLTEALPPATTREAALAYHSLLRHLVRLSPASDWQPVVQRLLVRSPLTALWIPIEDEQFPWEMALNLLQCPPLQALIRDRLLGLLPPPETWNHGRIDTTTARTNAAVGYVLDELLRRGGPAWLPFVLAFYEADCERQRCGTEEQPTWPLLVRLQQGQRHDDALQRRNGRWLLRRYLPLADLIEDERLFRSYGRLHGHFLTELGPLLRSHLKFRRVREERSERDGPGHTAVGTG